MIDGVKGFEPELNLLLLADGEHPADGHIHVERTWRAQEVASDVAESERAAWEGGEGSLVEHHVALSCPCCVARLPLVDVQRLPRDNVWPIIAFTRGGGIRAGTNVNRPAALSANRRRELPSTEEPVHWSLTVEWTVGNHCGVENVRDVEVAYRIVSPWIALDLEVRATEVPVEVPDAHAL